MEWKPGKLRGHEEQHNDIMLCDIVFIFFILNLSCSSFFACQNGELVVQDRFCFDKKSSETPLVAYFKLNLLIVIHGVSGLGRGFGVGERGRKNKNKQTKPKTTATVQNDMCACVSLSRNVAESGSRTSQQHHTDSSESQEVTKPPLIHLWCLTWPTPLHCKSLSS